MYRYSSKIERFTIENSKLTKQSSKKSLKNDNIGSNTYSKLAGVIGNRGASQVKFKKNDQNQC